MRRAVLGALALSLSLSACVVTKVAGPPASSASPSVSRPPAAAGSITPSPSPSPVFGDTFRDPRSGWTTETLASGTTFAYTAAGYVVGAMGGLHHFAFAPYNRAQARMGVAITATQAAGAPAGAGFGVACLQGSGTAAIRYEFFVTAGGVWYVERGDGAVSTSVAPVVLKQGSSPAAAGTTPLTVTASCDTQADGETTALSMSVGGTIVVTMDDEDATLPGTGWTSALEVVSSATGPSTVTVTKFQELDDAASGPA